MTGKTRHGSIVHNIPRYWRDRVWHRCPLIYLHLHVPWRDFRPGSGGFGDSEWFPHIRTEALMRDFRWQYVLEQGRQPTATDAEIMERLNRYNGSQLRTHRMKHVYDDGTIEMAAYYDMPPLGDHEDPTPDGWVKWSRRAINKRTGNVPQIIELSPKERYATDCHIPRRVVDLRNAEWSNRLTRSK